MKSKYIVRALFSIVCLIVWSVQPCQSKTSLPIDSKTGEPVMAVGIEKKNEKKVRKLWKRYWKSNGKKTKEIITELAVLGDAYAQYSIGYDIAFPKGISDDDIKNLRNAATKENLKKAYYYFDNATQKKC